MSLPQSEVDKIREEAEKVRQLHLLKTAYERHRDEVNPDSNWADWETCLNDGTADLVIEAMQNYASELLTKEREKANAELQAERERVKESVRQEYVASILACSEVAMKYHKGMNAIDNARFDTAMEIRKIIESNHSNNQKKEGTKPA